MTDNEIIKALECHRDERNSCSDCPYRHIGCSLKLTSDALALINRQKAKIETLETNCLSMAQTMPNMAKAERTEAIKEFAERLKALYTNDKVYDRPNPHTSLWVLFYNIDKLVKGMVGDKNEG